MLSLESPHRGDSNEYTQHPIFNIKKKNNKKQPFLIILSLPLWDFSKRLKNDFETAVVDEPSVFKPLKFYCMFNIIIFSLSSCKCKIFC